MPGPTTAGVAIRPASLADLDAITQLEEAAFKDFWPAEMLAYEISHPHSLLLVASRDEAGPPVGYAAFRHAMGEAELLRLAVLPAEQRRGVARALVAEGLERLLRESVQVCRLEVRADNAPAIALYHRLGFTRIGYRRGYYRDGSDALVFALEL